MKFRIGWFYFLGLVILISIMTTKSWASHVVGGNLEMITVDKTPGRFKIALNMYFDEINQDVGGVPNADALILVYRKSDNKRITSFYTNYFSRKPVTYANQTCATIRQIKTTLYRYEEIVNWNPSDYSDPAGYYMTWQYCCRNGDIDNIKQPSQAGQTFYLEFPPLELAGQYFMNSSPVFDQVDGEYMCVGDPFRFSFDAKDADGDELRYSMATPFDRLDPNVGVGSRNGLTIQWLPGFGPNNAIPGNPTLTINSQTGELNVTATQQGLFVFTVVVEEYRNGKVIGLVRRDYQLFAVDCPPTSPPNPTITSNNQPVTEIQFCEGKTISLKAIDNTNWDYQWRKDGKNIPGATTSTLLVTASGIYQLTTSLKAQCSKSKRSSDVKVTVTTSRFKLKSKGPLITCGPTGTVTLNAITGGGLTYQWYLDGKILPEQTNTLAAQRVGRYWAIVRDYVQGCTSVSDTVSILSASLPTITVTPQRSNTIICAGDSLLLTVTNQSNYTYQWSLNSNPLNGSTTSQLSVQQAGQYSVTVTDTTGCQSTTSPFLLAIAPKIIVTLDSLPKLCGLASASLITLKGFPAGGIFTGPGVVGNQFNPRIAGVGHHTIAYTVQNDLFCQRGMASKIAIIADPSVTLISDRSVSEICANDSLVLIASVPVNSSGYQFIWNRNEQSLQAGKNLVVRQAGRYQVYVIDSDGCKSQTQSYSLTIAPTILVTMDTITPLCGVDHNVIKLGGYPSGGLFSGPGVTDSQFDPRVAGVGTHILHYTINSPFACQNGVATRISIVRPIPTIDLGPDKEIAEGSSVQLQNNVNSSTYQYLWTPSTGLSDSTIVAPEASPQKTTSYSLTVQDAYGCKANDAIVVNVYEHIWIPAAFSPNGDGLNDSWELRGIDSYPQAEVTIFNRWGEIIFFSKGYKKPFNGYSNNQLMPTGIYAYQIKPSPTREPFQGILTIVR